MEEGRGELEELHQSGCKFLCPFQLGCNEAVCSFEAFERGKSSAY